MHLYDILFDHIAILSEKNSLGHSPTLSQGLWMQEAKLRINYLRGDHWDKSYIFNESSLLLELTAGH